MFKVTLSDTEGRVFPDNDRDEGYLYDFEDSHIANLASTLGINAMIGDGHFLLGNSGTSIDIKITGTQGIEGRREFEKYVSDLIGYIKDALPSMAENYFNFYSHFVRDYEENGLQMPMLLSLSVTSVVVFYAALKIIGRWIDVEGNSIVYAVSAKHSLQEYKREYNAYFNGFLYILRFVSVVTTIILFVTISNAVAFSVAILVFAALLIPAMMILTALHGHKVPAGSQELAVSAPEPQAKPSVDPRHITARF